MIITKTNLLESGLLKRFYGYGVVHVMIPLHFGNTETSDIVKIQFYH